MAIRFVVDSAADLLPEECAALGVVHVPLTVHFGQQEYLDSVTLSHRSFYEKLIESDTMPVTSQVPPDRFISAIRPLAEAGDTVIVITISSLLSGTCQSAHIAARKWHGQVYVVDSLNVTVGERLLLLRALELAAQGMTAQALVDRLNEEKKRIRLLAVLDTLEYLHKGGRISGTAAVAGGILGIKPAICIRDGAVVLCGKARGSKNVSNLIRQQIESGKGIDFSLPHGVVYSGLSDAMLQKYIVDNADLWQTAISEVPVSTIGCVIGAHVGPGAIGAAYFEKAD